MWNLHVSLRIQRNQLNKVCFWQPRLSRLTRIFTSFFRTFSLCFELTFLGRTRTLRKDRKNGRCSLQSENKLRVYRIRNICSQKQQIRRMCRLNLYEREKLMKTTQPNWVFPRWFGFRLRCSFFIFPATFRFDKHNQCYLFYISLFNLLLTLLSGILELRRATMGVHTAVVKKFIRFHFVSRCTL